MPALNDASGCDVSVAAPAASAGAPSAPPPAHGATRARRFNPLEVQGPSQEDATALVPPGYAISKDLKENRWRLRSKEIQEKPKSYGTGRPTFDGTSTGAPGEFLGNQNAAREYLNQLPKGSDEFKKRSED